MKLYLISQEANDGYDTYDSAVVAAETEEQAKTMSPSSFYEWDKDGEGWRFVYADGKRGELDRHSTWANPDQVKAEYIGEAADGIAGIVCASFNTG